MDLCEASLKIGSCKQHAFFIFFLRSAFTVIVAYGLKIFGQPNELESIDSIAAAICIHIDGHVGYILLSLGDIIETTEEQQRQWKRECGEWTEDYKFGADIQFQNLPKEYSWKALRAYLILYENRRVGHDYDCIMISIFYVQMGNACA